MLNLEQIKAYSLSSKLSDIIWNIVTRWSITAKKTIGDQLIRATDSVPANIAEGEGRHYKKDKIRFYYQARGSLVEVVHWVEKAKTRSLINVDEYRQIKALLEEIPKQIRFLISNANLKLKQ